jgi:ABC-type molybdate transport system substrate-binding protein
LACFDVDGILGCREIYFMVATSNGLPDSASIPERLDHETICSDHGDRCAAFANFTDRSVRAAEVKLLAAVGVREIITELAPQFESTSGHRLVTTFDASGRIAQRISGGEAFDLIMINKPAIERLANTGKLNAGSAKDIASSVVAAAVRKGAARPDISTTEAFKRALLSAKSISRPSATVGRSGTPELGRSRACDRAFSMDR